jgi:hypothetical protein
MIDSWKTERGEEVAGSTINVLPSIEPLAFEWEQV